METKKKLVGGWKHLYQQKHTLTLLDPTFLDDKHEYDQTRGTQTL